MKKRIHWKKIAILSIGIIIIAGAAFRFQKVNDGYKFYSDSVKSYLEYKK